VTATVLDPELPTCIDNPNDEPGRCEGKVEYRLPLSGTNIPYPRCDGHWTARLAKQEEHNRRYPVQQPADFDPLYAGERWNEDD